MLSIVESEYILCMLRTQFVEHEEK